MPAVAAPSVEVGSQPVGPAELLSAAVAASTWWFAAQLHGRLLNCWELVIPTFASQVYKGAASCACHLRSLAFPLPSLLLSG